MQGIVNGLADVLALILQAYRWVLIIAVLMHLVNADPMNRLVTFFRSATEPLFIWIRRRMPFVIMGGLDLSPLVVFCVIIFLERALVGNLRQLAH